MTSSASPRDASKTRSIACATPFSHPHHSTSSPRYVLPLNTLWSASNADSHSRRQHAIEARAAAAAAFVPARAPRTDRARVARARPRAARSSRSRHSARTLASEGFRIGHRAPRVRARRPGRGGAGGWRRGFQGGNRRERAKKSLFARLSTSDGFGARRVDVCRRARPRWVSMRGGDRAGRTQPNHQFGLVCLRVSSTLNAKVIFAFPGREAAVEQRRAALRDKWNLAVISTLPLSVRVLVAVHSSSSSRSPPTSQSQMSKFRVEDELNDRSPPLRT